MFGSIMPAPLAIAQMTTSPMRTLHTFGPRSVVKIARAASSRAAGRSLREMPSIAASTFSIGSGTPMTPVHDTTMSFAEMPSSLARLSASERTSRRPFGV